MTQDPDLQSTPTNVPAVLSLVAGLLLCIPATGLIAIPLGLIGMRRAKRMGGNGRTPARVGLVLGIINVLWWPALLIGALAQHRTYQLGRPAIESTRMFVRAVSTGNITDAKSLCTDTIDEGRLTETYETIQQWGQLEKLNAEWGGKYHGPADIEVTAEIKFEKLTKYITGHWKTTPQGPRLTSYELRDPPGGQSAAAPADTLANPPAGPAR